MKKCISVLAIVLLASISNAQLPQWVAELYPLPVSVKKEEFRPDDRVIYSGCAEGDCVAGKGTYICIYAEGFGTTGFSAEYANNVNLIYYISKGTFTNQGKQLNGVQAKIIVPLSRTRHPEDYKVLKTGQRVDLLSDGMQKGIFLYRERNFFGEGDIEMTGLAKQFNCRSVDAWCQDGAIKYATVRYNEKSRMKSFTGIVNDSLQPVFGIATYGDGSAFNGFFLREGTGPGYFFAAGEKTGKPMEGVEQFEFFPDITLLRNVFAMQHPMWYADFSFRWDKNKEDQLGLVNNMAVNFTPGKIIFGSGKYYNAAGIPSDGKFTGYGLYYRDHNLFYFGALNNGVPDGKGFLYYRYETMRRMNSREWPVQTHLRYGNFINGFFNEGRLTLDNGATIASAKLTESPVAEPGFLALEKRANSKDLAAIVELGDIYFSGAGTIRDVNKAISYYERAAVHGNLSALRKLGELYYNGNPSAGITRDSVKAIGYFRRGAELPVSESVTEKDKKQSTYLYFKNAYNYLTEQQAASFKLEDEYNIASEFSKLVIAHIQKLAKEREREEAAKNQVTYRMQPDELVGKLFFKDTVFQLSSTKYRAVTAFYRVQSVAGDVANVVFSYSNDPTIRGGTRPVLYFTHSRSSYQLAKKKYHTCPECDGKGYTTTSYVTKHTNDYEYTLGVRITYTSKTTTSIACPNCGGAGFCPADGSLPEWPYYH